ncbi:hypothetical protein C7M71_024335 [Peterkaempfera bronchialis]|uniref:Uncharacterized protein n=1 Tax=Peterkaempfera bronchialis TaxID=2126346 RepID=A0A345T6N0_9ACTN|nr:hypothetical protein [Peterkaempfera bronchialis]AXI81635.1 hypothetical protein C7M71_024335 [Peterkaempfera bronchialis]
MHKEPRAGRLAAWGNALLGGFAPPDDAASAVTGPDEAHRVTGLPGDGPADRHALTWALGRLRALGVTGFRLALPVPGHPLGLTGPAGFNDRAMAAGEAVLTVGGAALGLVPEVEWFGPPGDRAATVLWHCSPVREAPPADVPSLREAERELAEVMREATAVLARLDVGGAGPEALRALEAYRRRRHRELLAPGYPPRAVRVLESAQRVSALLAIAGGGDGAAVSASEMAARADALRPLERAARRAQVAAYNAAVDERAADEPS